MFKAQYGKSLDEETFESWLEKGRNSNIGYHYLLVIWDSLEEEYHPVFIEDRDGFKSYESLTPGKETLVAAYDLYSESRLIINN